MNNIYSQNIPIMDYFLRSNQAEISNIYFC